MPLLVAAALGFSLWAVSPILTGHAEPWDSEQPLYLVYSVLSGLALGWFAPRHLLRIYLGFWIGQIVALATLPGLDRGWLLLGVMTTAIGSLLVLGAAALGRLIRRQML